MQGIALDEPTPSGEASWRYLPAEELDLNPEVSSHRDTHR
jgi:hypothetical protein